MSDPKKPEALDDAALDGAQGGNLFDTWPVSVRGETKPGKDVILQFDEADAVISGKVITSEADKGDI